MNQSSVLTTQDVCSGYGTATVVRDISIDLLTNEIVGIIGKSQSEDISVFKIIKFIDQTTINKKEKLTNITISNIKDVQESVLINILKILINNIKELNNDLYYDVESIETIFNTYIDSSNISREIIFNYISI